MSREIEKSKDHSAAELHRAWLRWLTIFTLFITFPAQKMTEIAASAKTDSFHRKNSFHSGFSNSEHRVLMPSIIREVGEPSGESSSPNILKMTWLSALRIPNFQEMVRQLHTGQYTLTPEQTTAAIGQSAKAIDLLLGYFERGHAEGRFSSHEYQEMVSLDYKEKGQEIKKKLLEGIELFSVYRLSLAQGQENPAVLAELEGLITEADLLFLDRLLTLSFRYVDQQLSGAIAGEEFFEFSKNLLLGFALLLTSIQLASLASRHARQTSLGKSVSSAFATLPGRVLLKIQSRVQLNTDRAGTSTPGIDDPIERLAERDFGSTSPAPPRFQAKNTKNVK